MNNANFPPSLPLSLSLSLSPSPSLPLSPPCLQPVTSCSLNFPLRNYTLSINEVDVDTVTPSEVSSTNGLVTVTLSGSSLPGVVENSPYSLTVTAANDVTRKTSTPEIFC